MTNKNYKKTAIIMAIIILICVLFFAIKYNDGKKSAKADLYDAIRNNDIATVRAVLEKYPGLKNTYRYTFPRIDISSNTPLYEACSLKYDEDSLEIIKLLLENGANPNKGSNVVDVLPLTRVLTCSSDVKYQAAWFLIEAGADIMNVDRSYTFASAIVSSIPANTDSAQDEALELMKYAIENTDIYITPPMKPQTISSIYGMAACNGHTSIVRYLIESGYYKINDIVDDYNRSALIVAVRGYADFNDTYPMCRLLLELGIDKDITDVYGKTALDYAIENENQGLIELLR